VESLKKTGFYRLESVALNNKLWQLIGKYGAHLSSMEKKTFVIAKTGVISTWRSCTVN
jgi:hypothetical protein